MYQINCMYEYTGRDLNGDVASIQHPAYDEPTITSFSGCDFRHIISDISAFHRQLVVLHLTTRHSIQTLCLTKHAKMLAQCWHIMQPST